MKKWLFFWMILCAAVVNSNMSHADQGGGGEILYQYVNDSTYDFYFRLYVPCSSWNGGAPNMVSMCMRNSCTTASWETAFLYQASQTPWGTPNGQVIDPGCGNQSNSCNSTTSTVEMLKEWWYKGRVTLNTHCAQWTFSVNIQERDRDLLTNLTILPIYSHNLYIEATMNNVGSNAKQSSPYFSTAPPIYATAGAPFHYNNGAVDPNGDSLVYSPLMPRTATGDFSVQCFGYPPYNYTYQSGLYNVNTNPVLCNNSFTLNTATGDYSFTPIASTMQVAYIAFLVKKYRNGTLMGTVMRDFLMQINSGNSFNPTYTFNPTSLVGGSMVGDTVVVCGNTPTTFTYSVTGATGNIISVTDNSEISLKNAAISYSGQGTNSITGTVNWTPLAADTGFRWLVVYPKDSSCANNYPPSVGYAIPIKVVPGVKAFAVDTMICPGTSAKVYHIGGTSPVWTSLSPVGSISCAGCDTAVVSPKYNTQYVVSANVAAGCKSKDTVTVNVDTLTKIDITPDGPIGLCNGPEYVTLKAKATGPLPFMLPNCALSDSLCDGQTKDVVIGNSSTNSTIYNGFYNINQSYYVPFSLYNKTQKTQFIIHNDELKAMGISGGSISKLALNLDSIAGTNVAFKNVKISVNCTDKIEFVNNILGEFQIGLYQVYSQDSVPVTKGWNTFAFDKPFLLDSGKNLIVQICYSGSTPSNTNTTQTNLPVYYSFTDYYSTLMTGQSQPGDACASNIGTVNRYNRRPDVKLTMCELPTQPFTYQWAPETGLDDVHADSTGALVSNTGWYTVTTKSRYGCTVKDSIYFHVFNPDELAILPIDTNVCEGDPIIYRTRNIQSAVWTNEDFTTPSGFSCTNCANPTVTASIGTHVYSAAVVDSFGCGDTLSVKLTVWPKPNTQIYTQDTSIFYGDSVHLNAGGASTYNWSPAIYLNNPLIANPVASPTETITYVVTGYANNYCYNSDTVTITIKNGSNYYVPNAFSPNGDGVNDYFRIRGNGKPPIIAFNIFDRYGKLVYQSNNQSDPYWNGTYNGKPAAVGTYFYFIQVSLPNGDIKDLKGDVTLLR